MNKFILGIITSIVIIAAYYTFFLRPEQAQAPISYEIEPPPPPPPQVEPEPEPEPEIRFPLPETTEPMAETPAPLPPLDQSDNSVEQQFNEIIDTSQVADLLTFKTFIRNFVVIVDNMAARILPQKYNFFHPPSGRFMVTVNPDETIYLDPANYQRYEPFIKLVSSMDLDRLVQVYTYLYPLFQEAYEELGYPDAYFNDRLMEMITLLLETPQPTGPLELVQPKVYYRFAEPELEQLSAGQKLLIRLGPENAALVREKLRELQGQLKGLATQQRQ